jgi:hypothetical protein
VTSPLLISGLTGGTSYTIKLRAVNTAGPGTESAAVSVTALSLSGAPTGLVATAGNGSASIAFTAPTNNGGSAITNYQYSTNNGSSWTTRNPAAVTTPLVITGLVNGTTYSIKLRAVTAAGPGMASAVVTIMPKALTGFTGFDVDLSSNAGISASDIRIYPNPVSEGFLFIGSATTDVRISHIYLKDMSARVVAGEIKPELRKGKFMVLIPADLPNGNYVLEFEMGNTRIIRKILIMR